MATDRLVVKPAELHAKAAEVLREKTRISQALDTANNAINSLSATWQSGAADAYKVQFAKQYNELKNVLYMLEKHVKILDAAADTFTRGEQSLTSKNEALPVINITQ